MALKKKDFAHIYDRFESPVMRFDCGRMCAPLNDGEPVCCTTENAVPVVEKSEWKLLKKRTDLWHKYKPDDKAGHDIVDSLSKSCLAIECRGARHCERDNRSLSCRTFPFFPYITREREFIGLGYYWDFEDRCWVISNLEHVDRVFVSEFVQVFEYVFRKDPEEFDLFRDWSATMRRVFSRWDRPFPLIGRDGGWFKVLPKGKGIVKAGKRDLRKHGPFRSPEAYAEAVEEAEGTLPEGGLQ